MNQRIQELAEQATIKTSHQYLTWGDKVATEIKEVFDKEKFAELIVAECAGFIQDLVDQRIPASEYPTRLIEHFRIGENFGIDKNLRNRSTYFGNNP